MTYDEILDQLEKTIDARMRKSGNLSKKNRLACALDELWEVLTALENIDKELYTIIDDQDKGALLLQLKDAAQLKDEVIKNVLESILKKLKDGFDKKVKNCSTQDQDKKKICGKQFWKITALRSILSSLKEDYLPPSGKLGPDESPFEGMDI